MNYAFNKKRKINTEKVKNDTKNANLSQKNENDNILSSDDKELICYIRTLMSVKKFIPNIMSVIDAISDKIACNPFFASNNIFGDEKNGTLSQMNRLIDLGQRRDSLINLNLFIEDLINSLDERNRKFIKLKFIEKQSPANIAAELEVTERQVYRINKSVLLKLLSIAKRKNYSVCFIKFQLKSEQWVLPHLERQRRYVDQMFPQGEIR